MKKQIVNIINFIRNTEPREDVDLFEPVIEQIKLLEKHNLKGTFLFQYDALVNPEFINLFKDFAPDRFEFGVWLEIVDELCEKAGAKWNGKQSWDWHANCGFSVAYTLEERERIVDVLFNDFKEIFGYYPKVFGSWSFDAHTLEYANQKYGVDASCFCKEQWGTDGYTLWGGYYGQGYYPAKNNIYSPAQSISQQVNTPVFKMLGSDQIYQYDFGLNVNANTEVVQGVVTLEPVYTGSNGGGGNLEWVDWYLKENFSGNCLSFGYAQAGQENSFGWDKMRDGLVYQFARIEELCNEGKLTCETLGETGRWYKDTYKETPASTIVATTDWKDEEHQSVWYCNKNYRINLYAEGNKFWIRDIYLFDEKYMERYREDTCVTPYLKFDNLPVVDGNRFSGNGVRCGVYLSDSSTNALTFDDMVYQEIGEDAVVTFKNTQCGDVIFNLTQEGVSITADGEFALTYRYNKEADMPTIECHGDSKLRFNYNNFDYTIDISKGTILSDGSISSVEKEIVVTL